MTRKFASRGKFVGQEVMPYVSLLIVKLLASSITTLKSLIVSCGTTICGLKDISPHAHQWGGEIAILAEAVSLTQILAINFITCRHTEPST